MKFPYGSRDELAIMLRLWLRYIYDYMELPAADRTPTYEYIYGYVTSTYGYASEPCTLPGAQVFVIACSLCFILFIIRWWNALSSPLFLPAPLLP